MVSALLFLSVVAVLAACVAAARAIQAALRERALRAEQRARDDVASAERIARRLSDLAPARRPAPVRRAATTPAPLSTVRPVPRWRPARAADLVGVLLLVLLAIGVAMPRVAPGGVLGVQGGPATGAPVAAARPDTGGEAGTAGARAGYGQPEPAVALASVGPGVKIPWPGSPGQAAVGSGTSATPTPAGAHGTPGRTPTSVTSNPCDANRCTAYVVRHGDTLSHIAARFNVTVAAILAANPQVRDPSLIVSGQLLGIPPPAR